jgi:hypothetical protein
MEWSHLKKRGHSTWEVAARSLNADIVRVDAVIDHDGELLYDGDVGVRRSPLKRRKTS